MKSLFDSETVREFKQRINSLSPESERKWGTMSVTQMLAHCSTLLELGVGDRVIKPPFLLRLLGPLIKNFVLSPKPYKPNLPTAKEFIITKDEGFNREREKLISLLERFHRNGPQGVPSNPHPLFGKINAHDWDRSMYKHLDHHLRQFGS